MSSIPILTFHALVDDPDVLSFAPSVLAAGLGRLREQGWETLSFSEVGRLVSENAILPDRRFVITFDDGYRSVYNRAFPILQRNGMVATVFVTTGEPGAALGDRRLPSIQGREMMSWDEIREMREAGHEVGAHSLTHPDLTRIAIGEAEREIVTSRHVLEDALGCAITTFAYPFGRSNHDVRELVRRHFACACTDRLGFVTTRSSVEALERIDAYYLRSSSRLSALGTARMRWYIAARAIPRRLRQMLETTGR